MLPVNRQSILEKYYMQTFYKRSWDTVKRFDNVLKTLPNKCYDTLFIRPLKNVMKMLCVCWDPTDFLQYGSYGTVFGTYV